MGSTSFSRPVDSPDILWLEVLEVSVQKLLVRGQGEVLSQICVSAYLCLHKP